MKSFIVTLRSDGGLVRVRTAAFSPRGAIRKVCQAEGAPESAVVGIRIG